MTNIHGRGLYDIRCLPTIALFILVFVLLEVPHAVAEVAQDSMIAEPGKYQWKLENSENNCKSYSSEVAGKEYIAAKAVCDIPARLEVIAMILRDIENYPEWMADCKATRMLKVEDDEHDSFVFWFHQHIPLLKDRDMVLRSSVTIDYSKGIHLIEARSTEDIKFDSGRNVFRMPYFYTRYTLEWVDREHSRVTFLIDPDLGNGLPVRISNATIRNIPYRSMEGMRKMVTEKKYLEGAKSSKYAKRVEDAIRLGFLK